MSEDLELEELEKELDRLRDTYPFLTYLQFEETGIIGIVQNETKKMMSIYDLNLISGADYRVQFLKFGEEWWYESNNEIPIDIFIGENFDRFRHGLVSYPKNKIHKVVGPTVNLGQLFNKRVKKRKVELIRR